MANTDTRKLDNTWVMNETHAWKWTKPSRRVEFKNAEHADAWKADMEEHGFNIVDDRGSPGYNVWD